MIIYKNLEIKLSVLISKHKRELMFLLLLLFTPGLFLSPYIEETKAGANPTIEQQINILNSLNSVQTSSYAPTDNSLGLIHWDADKYAGATIYFEAVMANTAWNGKTYATLNSSSGVVVSGSEIYKSGTGYGRVRSGALTLTDDTDYTVRTKFSTAGGYIKAARLIIVQTDSEKIIDTSTLIEVGNTEKGTNSTATELENRKIYYYDSSTFDPAPTSYFEAVVKSSDPTIEQQINILNSLNSVQTSTYAPTDNSLGLIHWDADKYTGSTVYFEAILANTAWNGNTYAALYTSSGTVVSGSEINKSGSGYSRVRSGALTLTDDTDYSVRTKYSTAGGYIRAARLIIIQTSSTKITDSSTMIELGNTEKHSNNTAAELDNEKIYYYDDSSFSPAPTSYFEAGLKTSAPTIEQQINVLDQKFSVVSTSYSPTDNSLGLIHWDADKYTGATVYFEAVLANVVWNGSTYAALYESSGAVVSGSEVSMTGNGYSLVRSNALTLTDDTEYTVRSRFGTAMEQSVLHE
jgi:hypothetical protein